ncbi:MAG: phospho-N-acetylmuramoyl-pentapeptide-transferase [Ruminococcaceae bacterium]|nr:phospho-N-acetylmuramoyl-pentapeptide-transferase [Oscillospiraceae bacterium]
MSITGVSLLWFLGAMLMSFVITVILEKKYIPFLMRIKMGQNILEIGPRWHKNKQGTPTMGGIFFIAAIYITVFILSIVQAVTEGELSILILLLFMFINGLIGFADDYVKFIKKRNKGLSAMQKMVCQFAAAALFLLSMELGGYLDTSVVLPFSDIEIELGIFYYILSLFFIVFMTNSVNLTDGIDGLCASVTLVVMVLFGSMSMALSAAAGVCNITRLVLFGAIAGGMFGFLVYNFHPARIFMGDTGSLFLGSAVVGAAYLFNQPFIALVAGIIYVCESLSVVIQVISFKLTGKRVFKMSPIHHHFEMCGWGEIKIVAVFTVLTVVFSVLAYFMFV